MSTAGWVVSLIIQGIWCFSVGVWAGKSADDKSKHFIPTQETWLELEKYRWSHAKDGGNVHE